MPLLEQQEIVEPPPLRSIIVRPGHAAYWGADLGTTRLALAFIDPRDGRRGSRTVPFPVLRGAARLAAIYTATRLEMHSALRQGWPAPGVVMTEQPSGSKQAVNLPFIMAAGAIQAGMHEGLAAHFGYPVVIEDCVAAHWKKVAVGRTFGKPKREKGKPAPPLRAYPAFVWAEQNGWHPLDWNEADAAGMADCARREIGLVER